MKLTFYGGAKIVTGANHLLEVGDLKILVDCGLFQGSKFAEFLNYEKFSYDPKEIDYVFLTHSHADHVGRIPKLYREGFRGKVLALPPTIDMVKVVMPNSLALIREEALRDDHEPLFREEDLINSMLLFQGIEYEKEVPLATDTTVEFLNAGHILGSAMVEIKHQGQKIPFSGDLGNPPSPLLNDPADINGADYLVIESAYGGRIHEDREERRTILAKVVDDTVAKGGTLMIPSFALERTQEILYELNGLFLEKSIPNVPIFLDSPLAIELTRVYEDYLTYFNSKAQKLISSGDDIFSFPQLKLTRSSDESKSINKVLGPKVIIAGSGMSNGGRILHHEARYLPDPNSAVLFIGYQVEKSLGRQVLEGAKNVTIFGAHIPVNAKVVAIGGYSGHADQKFILDWISKGNASHKIKKVFVVQGEIESATALADKIKQNLGIEAIVPSQADSFEL